jgi:hypothetical protein
MLQWIGIASGLLAIIGAAVNLYILWQNRRRIEFRTIAAAIYVERWKQYQIDQGRAERSPDDPVRAPIKDGDIRRAFVVAEFSIRNEHPTEVTVGRFKIDEWMFADRKTPEMYSFKQDYRVFDLYTREQTSLEQYTKVPAKGSCGFRIEVLEDTSGPGWQSSKSRYTLRLPRGYVVEFYADNSKRRAKISFPRQRITELDSFSSFHIIHRWSSDLLDPQQQLSVAPRPLGTESRPWRQPWRSWLRMQWSRTSRWILYGTPDNCSPKQLNRLQKVARAIQAKRAKG